VARTHAPAPTSTSTHALRLPQTCRGEALLCQALAKRLPALVEDYAVPMLRVDLTPTNLGAQRQVYLAYEALSY
jgi:hypothetical protein